MNTKPTTNGRHRQRSNSRFMCLSMCTLLLPYYSASAFRLSTTAVTSESLIPVPWNVPMKMKLQELPPSQLLPPTMFRPPYPTTATKRLSIPAPRPRPSFSYSGHDSSAPRLERSRLGFYVHDDAQVPCILHASTQQPPPKHDRENSPTSASLDWNKELPFLYNMTSKGSSSSLWNLSPKQQSFATGSRSEDAAIPSKTKSRRGRPTNKKTNSVSRTSLVLSTAVRAATSVKGGNQTRTTPHMAQLPADAWPATLLAEWTGLEPLLHRRKAIREEMTHGKQPPRPTAAGMLNDKVRRETSVSDIQRIFSQESPTTNNLEAMDLYAAAKKADQRGEVEVAKQLLLQLVTETPNDMRLYRRLSRLEADQGRLSQAMEYIQQGLHAKPKDAYLLHAMATLATSKYEAKKLYRQSIASDPSIPNSHHALGVLEHSQGHIASAIRILQYGIRHVPPSQSHRLHHALGDVYREARAFSMATASYRRSLQHLNNENLAGFCYTALAFVKYEEGKVNECRQWLIKAVSLNNGRNANAWKALAQMEEAEGNIHAARAACMAGLAQYERGLLHKSGKKLKMNMDDFMANLAKDPVQLKDAFREQVPVYRAGDRFYNVYRNWLRLEERYGKAEAVEEIYERARVAFPNDYRVPLDTAQYFAKLHIEDKARQIFEVACSVSTGHSDPHRLHAEYEMKQGNYERAREILYRGAAKVTRADCKKNPCELSNLFHTWAICEWHLGDLGRAETLFDNALRMTENGQGGARQRSVILYSIAKLEHSRGKDLLSQHCIGLCLKEGLEGGDLPGGISNVWQLWAEVATSMGNTHLAQQCQQEMDCCLKTLGSNEVHFKDMRQIFLTPDDMARMLRREPWQPKLFQQEPITRIPKLPV